MNEKQSRDLKALRQVEPNLTEEEFLTFSCNLYSWDGRNSRQLQKKLDRLRMAAHRNVELKKYNAKSWSAGRCYTKGHETWARQDDEPLTEKDFESLRVLSYGQSTMTKGTPGDKEAFINWACDSGD